MKIALIYNLRPAQATMPAWPDDLYAEWDEPETIAAVRAALATAHEVLLIEKPMHEGSSKGIEPAALVQTRAALQARVAYVLATYRQPALVEAFVPGREFTVALLGNGAEVTVLPLVEICFAALPPGALPLYGYAAKWLWDTPEHALDLLRCPADLPVDLARSIADLCRRAFLALECRDWCRIDVRLDT